MRLPLPLAAIGLAVAGVAYSPDALSQSRPSLARLVSNYIERDAEHWSFNEYDQGSMRNVRVVAGSVASGNYSVRGEYTYNNGRPGWMIAKHVRGKLDCLEFWDSYGCRTPRWVELEDDRQYAGPERNPRGCVLSNPDPRC